MTWPQRKPKLTTYQPLYINMPSMRSTPVSNTEPRVVSPDVTTNNIRDETTSRHRSTEVSNKALPRAADGVGRRVPGASKQPSKMTDDDGFKLVTGKKVRKNGTQAVIGTRKGKHDCHLLNTCNASYVDYGISPLDASCGILSGRPYGGVGFYGNAPWINILPYLIIVMIGFVA